MRGLKKSCTFFSFFIRDISVYSLKATLKEKTTPCESIPQYIQTRASTRELPTSRDSTSQANCLVGLLSWWRAAAKGLRAEASKSERERESTLAPARHARVLSAGGKQHNSRDSRCGGRGGGGRGVKLDYRRVWVRARGIATRHSTERRLVDALSALPNMGQSPRSIHKTTGRAAARLSLCATPTHYTRRASSTHT